LRLFSFGAYGLALAALALVVFGAIECLPPFLCLCFSFEQMLRHLEYERLALEVSDF